MEMSFEKNSSAMMKKEGADRVTLFSTLPPIFESMLTIATSDMVQKQAKLSILTSVVRGEGLRA